MVTEVSDGYQAMLKEIYPPPPVLTPEEFAKARAEIAAWNHERRWFYRRRRALRIVRTPFRWLAYLFAWLGGVSLER